MNDLYITPCIGVCKAENGICKGCGRTIEEISRWPRLSYEERMTIMRRLGFAKRRKKSE